MFFLLHSTNCDKDIIGVKYFLTCEKMYNTIYYIFKYFKYFFSSYHVRLYVWIYLTVVLYTESLHVTNNLSQSYLKRVLKSSQHKKWNLIRQKICNILDILYLIFLRRLHYNKYTNKLFLDICFVISSIFIHSFTTAHAVEINKCKYGNS